MTKAADDFNSIARRLQEIEAEKVGNGGFLSHAANRNGVTFMGVPTGGASASITIKWADLPPYTPKQVNG